MFNNINFDKIYASEPDAIVRLLSSLDEFLPFSQSIPFGDKAKISASLSAIEGRGLRSNFFGHVLGPDLHIAYFDKGTSSEFGSVVAHKVGNIELAVLNLLSISEINNPDVKIYATEARSPMAMALRARYYNFIGSQYAPDPEQQKQLFPIVHQDLTHLTHPDSSFDAVLSIEVLEHVPDLQKALSEIARVLRPGGLLIATFPFYWGSADTKPTARLSDGNVVHLVEKPEYHGDPMNKDGILVYQNIGWDIVPLCKSVGFSEAKMVFYSSSSGGIMGRHAIGLFILVCER